MDRMKLWTSVFASAIYIFIFYYDALADSKSSEPFTEEKQYALRFV